MYPQQGQVYVTNLTSHSELQPLVENTTILSVIIFFFQLLYSKNSKIPLDAMIEKIGAT
ncbi:hypothetical protein BACI9J_60291 [Bacillus altitudinis]|nr:hypothetical protein BACI9J_60291 [Bacillus altitudinis]